MATARDTIKSSMRLAGILEANEAPDAGEAVDALTALNEMLHSWANHGIFVAHVDLGLDDEVKLPASYMQAVRYMLAIRLAPEYGKQTAPEVAGIAENEYRKLQALHSEPEEAEFDGALARIGRSRTGDRL